MTGIPHNHREHVAGCFRCELSLDEVKEQHRDNGCKVYDEKLATCTCPKDDE